MLRTPKQIDPALLKKDLRKQASLLEETLMSFGIEAKVGDIHCGPTITSFEVHPSVGVKVQKIKALENDIALNLQAKSIRIIAPIPGKAVVGVEIPSLIPQEVGFKRAFAILPAGETKGPNPDFTWENRHRRNCDERFGQDAPLHHRRCDRIGKIGLYQHHRHVDRDECRPR